MGLETLTFGQLITLGSITIFAAVYLAVILLGPAWDHVSSRAMANLTPRLNDLQIGTERLSQYLRYWGSAMLISFITLFFFLGQIPLSFAVTYLIYVAPHYIIEFIIARRRRLLRDQMVGASVGLANSVRAGLSLAQGLESICPETPEPLASELRRVVFEWHCGRPLSESIIEVKNRLKLDSFTLFAVAICACIERGGKITDALERISHSLGENQRLERKLEADTSSGRSTVIVLAAFPFLFLLFFLLVDTQSTSLLFSTLRGQFIFTGIIGTIYLAVKWCIHILKHDI